MPQKKSISRVYIPYYAWEETYTSMWRSAEDRKKSLSVAVKFTGDHKKYGKWMFEVVKRWPVSCVHNLSCRGSNRQAWIGHAACALALDLPEDIVRQAWSLLSEDQQNKANKQADNAIELWEQKYIGGPWQKSIWE